MRNDKELIVVGDRVLVKVEEGEERTKVGLYLPTTAMEGQPVQGGTIMAPTPDRGVVNPYLQHWQLPNLFVLGASTFPNTGSANPKPRIFALTYRTADALVDRYLKKPAPLP